MLDITTNPYAMTTTTTNNAGAASTASMNELIDLDDDEMDRLFDDDWLHEHNLDILFDLFEEEMENDSGKMGYMDPTAAASANNGSSSTIFGTSPITSYLFGTSPSLASALDLYDLLYFDQQQQQQQQQQPHLNTSSPTQQHQSHQHTSAQNSSNSNNNLPTYNQMSNHTNQQTGSVGKAVQASNVGGIGQQQQVIAGAPTSSITNAMKIKRKFKKGQSQGVSLLARPFSSTSNTICGTGNNNNNIKNNKHCSNNSSIINKNNSDKISTKVTNFKKTIIGCNNNNINNNSRHTTSNGIDINYSKKNQHKDRNIHHYHHHVHYITGRAVIREHAYAMCSH